MIRSLDRGVGRVMQALKANGLDENTLVMFTSDNGGAGYIGLPDVNEPYRGWKITLFEGVFGCRFWPAGRPVCLLEKHLMRRCITSICMPPPRQRRVLTCPPTGLWTVLI